MTTPAKPFLGLGFLAVALKLQEAAGDLSNNDVARRLGDAVSDAHRGTGSWAYYVDHFGDADSGDVIYSCSGCFKRAPYSISAGGDGTATIYSIDTANADEVTPRTIYELQPDEDDHYAAMESAAKADGSYLDLPLYERFIGKDERNSAESGDFAGKGKSFPILKPQDVAAAAKALGRAGPDNLSVGTIKSRIISIAKRKGWAKYLPKTWQGAGEKAAPAPATPAKESAGAVEDAEISLVESASAECFVGDIRLVEAARSTYPVKLISPGTGTMAHYPEAVLERDGPKVFKAGTLMFWNHPTLKEAAERPEGDLNNLAAILVKDAYYDRTGAKGPGLYSEAKIMADYAQKVEERAPHIGLSIRAGGQGSGKMVNGKPELKNILYAESVDYVTKAGRGGLALAEAARDAGLLPPIETKESATADQEKEMDEKAIKELVESAVTTAVTSALAGIPKVVSEALGPVQAELTETKGQNQLLLERALRGDAREEADDVLSTVELPAASKTRIVSECLRGTIPATKDGQLDKVAFRESVDKAAKSEAAYVGAITKPGQVRGMGSPAPVVIDATEAARRVEEDKKFQESAEAVFARFTGGDTAAAKAAANKGVAA